MTLLQSRGREQQERSRALSDPSEEGHAMLRLLAVLVPYPNLTLQLFLISVRRLRNCKILSCSPLLFKLLAMKVSS